MHKILRHVVVAVFSLVIYYIFHVIYVAYIEGHHMWRALGDASFVLLFLALIIGPITKIWPRSGVVLPWRRVSEI